MKVEDLKLYNKYKNIYFSTIEFIYIGIDNKNKYWFLYKNEDCILKFSTLKRFDPDKIVKDLKLKTYIDIYGKKYIEGYGYTFYSKKHIKQYFKPILKDKLKNIINR